MSESNMQKMQSASDYIPTTEDIKYAYAHWKSQEPEFDRWLAEVKAQAWEEGMLEGQDNYYGSPSNPYRQDV